MSKTGLAEQFTVAHVVLSLAPGGLERLVCSLIEAADMRDVRPLVVCFDKRGDLAGAAEDAGARVIVVGRRSGFDAALIMRLQRLFRRENVTVIAVTHDPTISEVASRILSIRDGQIVEDSPLNV